MIGDLEVMTGGDGNVMGQRQNGLLERNVSLPHFFLFVVGFFYCVTGGRGF